MRTQAPRIKKWGEAPFPDFSPLEECRPPERVRPGGLEFELGSQADRRRELEDRALAVERVTDIRHASYATGDGESGVLANRALRIGHVEPIEREAQFLALLDRNGVIGAEVQVIGYRRSITARDRVDRCAARQAEAFIVAVDQIRNQLIERNARLGAKRSAGREFERPLVAAVELELMR